MVMSFKNFASIKFSQICDLPDSEIHFMLNKNGVLFDVYLSRYHFYYLTVIRVGSEFPFLNCRVRGSQCLDDFKF